jgi:hypothetical protein
MLKQTVMNKLKFQRGNAKLGKNIYTFSLPSGHSCPFADECLSKSDKETGKLKDGPNTRFRCFSATAEAVYTNTRKARWHNFDLLRSLSKSDMTNLIDASLPDKAEIVRLHVAGDFFNQKYFDAWIEIAKKYPGKLFYAYTKSVKYWISRLDLVPGNLKLNASRGGKTDHLIDSNGLKSAEVVFSEAEARKKKIKIDHDDSLAYTQNKSFALLLHGPQPKGTVSAKALSILKNKGFLGYSKKRKTNF